MALSEQDRALVMAVMGDEAVTFPGAFASARVFTMSAEQVAALIAAARAEGFLAKSASNPALKQFAKSAKCSAPAAKEESHGR